MSVRAHRRGLPLLLAAALAAGAPVPIAAGEEATTAAMRRQAADALPAEPLAPQHLTPCVDGLAGSYPCDRVDLLEFLPLAQIGGASGANDIWGWTHTPSGREFALVGLTSGTAFVEITDPEAPVYLGRLPTHTANSTWRDIKTYAGHAFVVSEASGHGLQVFELAQLLSVANPPATFAESAFYGGFGNAHNLAIDEATGFAYAVGTGTCSGGLHVVNIQNPSSPVGAGCFSADGYTHDAQCILYDGPDADFLGHEVCFAANEDTLTLVDVTDKGAPVQISRTAYTGRGYTHQGWLTEDRAHFLVDDELDEQNLGHNTWTYVWDVRDLHAPELLGHYESPVAAIDHNQYVVGDYSYQANYRAGLRILRLGDLDAPGGPEITQAAYFDIYPASDSANFNGAWSVYPYFPSGVVVVSGIEQGLFVLQPRLCSAPLAPAGLGATPGGDQRIDLAWTGSGAPDARFAVERAQGGCAGVFQEIAGALATPAYSDTTASGQVTYGYRVVERDPSGLCASPASTCVEATTTGSCTAPPIFAGLASAATPGTAWCVARLDWDAGAAACGGPVSYDVFRSTDPQFLPDAGNRIATGIAGRRFDDFDAAPGIAYSYLVRAADGANGARDVNLVRRPATALGPIGDGTFATGGEIGDPALDAFAGSGAAPDAVDHVGWHFSSARSHAGARSFFSTAANGLCVSLVAGPLALTAGQSPTLGFWTVYDTETAYDGGVVEIRPAGGGAWTTLALSPAYPGSFNSGSDACGYANGTPSFTGSSLAWSQRTAALAAWAGQSVEIRWNFSTDGSQLGEGWYVDDVTITHAQVPGLCAAGGGLFADDFEGGTAARWSGAEALAP